jgi:glycogen(starch) synthase
MKILEIVPEWPPFVIGGGGHVFREIARSLASRHDVTVVFGDYSNRSLFAAAERTSTGKLRLMRLPLVPTPSSTTWLRTVLPPVMPAFASLFSVLSERWDVAHLHGLAFPMIDVSAALLRRRGVPYVFTIHGVPASPLRRNAFVRNAFLWYVKRISARTVMGAARLTAVSRSLLRDALVPRREGTVVHNGLLDSDFDASVDHTQPGATPLLVSLGRLSANKGIDIAIEALAILTAAGQEVRYDIWGPDGGEAAAFKRLAAQLGLDRRVRFLGAFQPEDRRRILAAADVVLVPSRVEGFGIVALEAAAAGVPVVASDVDGLAEFLSPENAMLVPPADPSALAAAIKEALQPQVRAQRIVAARSLAERFRWKNVVGDYERELTIAARPVRAS